MGAAMPLYEYHCPENGQTVTVRHASTLRLKVWGEVCYAAQVALGETDFMSPVERLIGAPAVVKSVSNAELRNMGFTKLVRRDDGVYENLTPLDDESRVMEAGRPETLPDFKRKVTD